MGIKNLNSVLKNYNIFPKMKISDISGSIVGIDFSLFLYRFIYNQNNPFECFLRQIILLLKYNILPVYVLDGIAPYEKINILTRRAFKRLKLSEELEKLIELREKLIYDNSSPKKIDILDEEINKLEKKCVHFSKEVTNNLIDFFEICGIPVIQENCESDFILAKLNENKLIDYVLSEDSDLFAFGARKVLKNFSIQEESFNLYDKDKMLEALEFNQNEFIDMCILCGCDYTPKIKNLNCSKSFELIKELKEIENIKDYNINIHSINLARNVFKKEIDNELLIELKNKIIKKEFNYNKIEEFLNNKIEKKYLIPIFIRTSKKFLNYKFSITK